MRQSAAPCDLILDRSHTQANAIDFINYVVKKFPFRIYTIRTDRGHEPGGSPVWLYHRFNLSHRDKDMGIHPSLMKSS